MQHDLQCKLKTHTLINEVMEEKKINEKESLAIITEMIDRTKNRLRIGDGNMLLLWGYTSLAVTALTLSVLIITEHPASNWLWFLIWIIGGSASARICRRRDCDSTVRNYIDNITSGLWSLVGSCAILITAICLIMMLAGGKDCWVAMLVFGLLIVGIAVAIQGFIIKEKSLVAGGSVGILCGSLVMCFAISGISISIWWAFPLIAVPFLLMLIVPGHILNYKARRLCSKN